MEKRIKSNFRNKKVSLKRSWIQINAHTQRSAHSMQTLAAHIFGKHRESNSNINLAFNMINCTTFSLYERRLLECSSFHSFFFVRVFCTPYTLFINIIDSPCVYRCSRNFFCYCLCFAIKIRQLQHKYKEREREDMVSVEVCLERVRGNKDKFKKLKFFSFVDS